MDCRLYLKRSSYYSDLKCIYCIECVVCTCVVCHVMCALHHFTNEVPYGKIQSFELNHLIEQIHLDGHRMLAPLACPWQTSAATVKGVSESGSMPP